MIFFIRRAYAGGSNSNIVVGIEPTRNDPRDLQHYMDTCKPYVLILSPTSKHMGEIAGMMAAIQMSAGRHFVVDQLWDNCVYTLPIWQQLAQHVAWCYVHHCSVGLVDEHTQRPLDKVSEVWASDERLVSPLRGFVCKCTQRHAVADWDVAAKPQVLPTAISRGIAKGC